MIHFWDLKTLDFEIYLLNARIYKNSFEYKEIPIKYLIYSSEMIEFQNLWSWNIWIVEFPKTFTMKYYNSTITFTMKSSLTLQEQALSY